MNAHEAVTWMGSKQWKTQYPNVEKWYNEQCCAMPQWLITRITTKVKIYAFLAYKMCFLLDLTLQSILLHKTHCCPHKSRLAVTCFCGWISWKGYDYAIANVITFSQGTLVHVHLDFHFAHQSRFSHLRFPPHSGKVLLFSHAWSNQNKHFRSIHLHPILCPYKFITQNLS